MHILLVEDNDALARSIVKGLKKNGYAVDHFADGGKAFDHFVVNNQSYDAVILDLMLPGRSGSELCTAIRERQISTPILIVTAKDSLADKVVLLNAGADDYITKPFEFAELLARLRAVTRRPSELTPDELVVGNMRIVTSQQRAFVENELLQLTTREFVLLELFMRNANQVLTREFILDHVWDAEFTSLSNVVDVHVKNLRKKLEDTPAAGIIETVTGTGYRLQA